MELGVWGWGAAAIAVVLTGISKSGFGGALGGLAVPVLALWMPAPFAVGVMLPVLIAMDILGLRAWRREASMADLRWMLPGALAGIALGSALLHVLDTRWCQLLIGVIAVVFGLERLWQRWRSTSPAVQPVRPSLAAWCGAAAGVTSTLAHAGGPPAMYYLLWRGLPKTVFVASLVVLFTGINLAKLPFYLGMGLITRETLWLSLCLLPCVPAGVWLGVKVIRHIPDKLFFSVTVLALLGTGSHLVWDALQALAQPGTT
jgi:uncharacterized membrane protein YfcA